MSQDNVEVQEEQQKEANDAIDIKKLTPEQIAELDPSTLTAEQQKELISTLNGKVGHWVKQSRLHEATAKANSEAASKWSEHAKTLPDDIDALKAELETLRKEKAAAAHEVAIQELFTASGLDPKFAPLVAGMDLQKAGEHIKILQETLPTTPVVEPKTNPTSGTSNGPKVDEIDDSWEAVDAATGVTQSIITSDNPL